MSDQSLVFLSSTVDDMKEERDAVSEVISILKQKISRCEYFAARSESAKEVCLGEAERCDIFIGIFKERYGSIPADDNPSGISVTEMEYQKAREKKKPILLFYHQDSSKRESKLEMFLNKVKNFSKGHYVQKFRNIDELKFLVLQSLVLNLKIMPQILNEEKISLNSLVSPIIKYQKVLLDQFEYNITSGISKPATLIQYRAKDLYVPPEILKYTEEYKLKIRARVLPPLSYLAHDTSWDEIEKIETEKVKVETLISTGINIINKIQERRPTVIIGAPGSGKSTLTKYLSADLLLNSSIIPIYVQVRDLSSYFFNNQSESIIEFL